MVKAMGHILSPLGKWTINLPVTILLCNPLSTIHHSLISCNIFQLIVDELTIIPYFPDHCNFPGRSLGGNLSSAKACKRGILFTLLSVQLDGLTAFLGRFEDWIPAVCSGILRFFLACTCIWLWLLFLLVMQTGNF